LHSNKTIRQVVVTGQESVKKLATEKDNAYLSDKKPLDLRQITGQLKQIRNTLQATLGRVESLLNKIS